MSNHEEHVYERLESLGKGSCGEVFRVKLDDGSMGALKNLSPMHINKSWINDTLRRVERFQSELVGVAIPLYYRLESSHPEIIFPLYGQQRGKQWMQNTLEEVYDGKDLDQRQKWVLVHQIAEAIASMHRGGIAHSNLSPTNIMFEEGKDEGVYHVRLVDYAMGHIGGVHHHVPSLACLFMSPEQLLEPEAMHSGEPFRWDVYAFGVLSWRLWTAVFPRCHDDFVEIGGKISEGKALDLGAHDIAEMLIQERDIDVSVHTTDKQQLEVLTLLQSCLSLDPMQRPADMREVFQRLVTIEDERVSLLALEKWQYEKRKGKLEKGWLLGGFITLFILLMGSFIWLLMLIMDVDERDSKLSYIENQHSQELDELEDSYQLLLAQKELDVDNAQWDLERSESRAQAAAASLADSQRIGTMLLETVGLRKTPSQPGFREHPLLLQQLLEYYQQFLADFGDDRSILLEVARSREAVATLAEAQGNSRLERDARRAALRDWLSLHEMFPHEESIMEAIVRGRLYFATERYEQMELDVAWDLCAQATRMTEDLVGEKYQLIRVMYLAQLRALQGNILNQQNHNEQALEYFSQALDLYDSIKGEAHFREDAIERGGQVLAYRGATLLDLNQLEDARSALTDALEALRGLRREHPEWDSTRRNEASVLLDLAQLAEYSGKLNYANNALKQALTLAENLDHSERLNLLTKAKIQRALAMSERNFGRSEQARVLMQESVMVFDRLLEMAPERLDYRLEYARTQWDAGALSDQLGREGEAVKLTQNAIDQGVAVRDDASATPAQVRLSELLIAEGELTLGYLYSTSEVNSDRNRQLAREAFQRAIDVTDELIEQYPDDADVRAIRRDAMDRIERLL